MKKTILLPIVMAVLMLPFIYAELCSTDWIDYNQSKGGMDTGETTWNNTVGFNHLKMADGGWLNIDIAGSRANYSNEQGNANSEFSMHLVTNGATMPDPIVNLSDPINGTIKWCFYDNQSEQTTHMDIYDENENLLIAVGVREDATHYRVNDNAVWKQTMIRPTTPTWMCFRAVSNGTDINVSYDGNGTTIYNLTTTVEGRSMYTARIENDFSAGSFFYDSLFIYENSTCPVMSPIPKVTITNPPDATTNSSTTMDVRFSYEDGDNTSINCTLYVEGIQPVSNASTKRFNVTTLSVTLINDSTYSYNVSCFDGVNTGNATTRTYTLDTPPIVSITSPQASDTFREGSITIETSITETHYNQTTFFLKNETGTTITSISNTNGSFTNVFNDVLFEDYGESIIINVTHKDNFSKVGSDKVTLFRSRLTNCSGIYTNTTALKVLLINESTDAIINGTMEFLFSFYNQESSISEQNYSTIVKNTRNISFCIFPTNATLITSTNIDFTSDGITHFKYFTDELNLSNITKTLSLYVSEGTTQITLNVKDTSSNDLEGAVIIIDKFSIATNSYKTVEILETSFDGNAYANLILNTAYYRFTIKYGGEVKKVTDKQNVVSTTLNFQINLLADDWYVDFDKYQDISYNLSFSNSSIKKFRLQWYDPNSKLSQICLSAKEVNRTGSKELNGTARCASTYSGEILYDIGNESQVFDKRFLATAYVIINKNKFILDSLEQSFLTMEGIYDDKDHYGVFVTFLFVLTLFYIALWHPIPAILFGITGIGIMRVLHIFKMSWVSFITLIVVGIITIWRINNAK